MGQEEHHRDVREHCGQREEERCDAEEDDRALSIRAEQRQGEVRAICQVGCGEQSTRGHGYHQRRQQRLDAWSKALCEIGDWAI